jgi:hypothetical protein
MLIITSDNEFHDWLDANPGGYFLKARRGSRPSPILHLSTCPHYDRSPKVRWTHSLKACSTSRSELETFSRSEFGLEATRCRSCFG